MKGKIAVIVLILAPILVGGGIWYAQEYGYYRTVEPGSPAARIQITTAEGQEDITGSAFQIIDADSSPIRWRACFRLEGELPGTIPFDDPTPLVAPGWFDCFDSVQIGADLESGKARAVLAQPEIHPDVDRVLAIYPDGRAYGWHQYSNKTPERGVMD